MMLLAISAPAGQACDVGTVHAPCARRGQSVPGLSAKCECYDPLREADSRKELRFGWHESALSR